MTVAARAELESDIKRVLAERLDKGQQSMVKPLAHELASLAEEHFSSLALAGILAERTKALLQALEALDIQAERADKAEQRIEHLLRLGDALAASLQKQDDAVRIQSVGDWARRRNEVE